MGFAVRDRWPWGDMALKKQHDNVFSVRLAFGLTIVMAEINQLAKPEKSAMAGSL
jgi:hypothetical protein